MSFLSDEGSVESSRPREGIEIILPSVTYRIATGTRDIEIHGEAYTAAPAQRNEIVVPRNGDSTTPELVLHPKHPLVSRFMLGGVPPRNILVNVYRKQTGGAVEVVWRGRVTSLTWRDGLPVFAMPSRQLLLLDRRLPSFSVGKHCPHLLYGPNCKANRAGFRVATTIASVNGTSITVASMGAHPNTWARYGELLHVATGELMTIAEQTGSVLTIPQPIGGMRTGDAVEVFAGCARTIDVCHGKFDNRRNFGGFPHLNVDNIPVPPGFGVYVSS